MRRALATYCIFQFSCIASCASAQNANNFMNLFGGIMQAAIMQAALAEWQKLPPAELSCIDETLQQRGLSVRSLMQQGITPLDIRLADLRASCGPKMETNLNVSPPPETLVGKNRCMPLRG
jgi:hypothetical protein